VLGVHCTRRLVRRLHEPTMVSTRRGPPFGMSLADGGIRLFQEVWCWMTAWEGTERIALWFLSGPPGRPITGVRALLPHRPSPRQGLWKIHKRHPSVSSGPCFFLDVGTAGCLEVATCGIAGCGLRATGCGQFDARLTPRPVLIFGEGGRGGWISALDPLVLCSPHVALGPMATDLRWHRPGIPF
jgi:hypothetical protein